MSSRLHTRFIPIWKEAPSLKYLVPLIIGIVLQWYLQPSSTVLFTAAAVAAIAFIICFFTKYKATPIIGIVVTAIMVIAGCWLVVLKDQRNWSNHIGRFYREGTSVIATLQEPLVTKPKSYKAEATVELIDSVGNARQVAGNVIIYFKKDSLAPPLKYGSRIVFTKSMQAIKNLGNPGGFDYERNSIFNGNFYQINLKPEEYKIDEYTNINAFRQSLFAAREFVIGVFKKYIPGQKEVGLAEALLINYKDDLDKDLVEQYASTGVVHIIAISGMHLGLIYGLLIFLLKPLGKRKWGLVINAIITIAALWLFSLLTGANPSIVRSAIMFTVIISGSIFSKKSSIYSSLSVSAFVLLLYNPFNLWDVGFQLSYAALLSIAVWGNWVSNWIFIRVKWLQQIWQLIAVTIAAQIITLPLVIYHFHQFPLSFILSNIIAVPVSSLILYGLILLLVVSWFKIVASFVGICLHYAIWFLNEYIGAIAKLPFSRIDEIYYTIPQAVMLYLFIAALAWWLLRKSSAALIPALSFLLFFLGLRSLQQYQIQTQQKLIVYNVPQKQAIDIIRGGHYIFIGDTALQYKAFLQNFHLLPSRILHQATFQTNICLANDSFNKIKLGNEELLIVDKNVNLKESENVKTDYLLISKNIKTKPAELLRRVQCKTVIVDASNSSWHVAQWKSAADSLHLRLYNVQEQGAFVYNF